MKIEITQEEYREAVGNARFEGFAEGIENERLKWAATLIPQSVEITIRVRGGYEETEAIRKVLTFEDIKQSNLKSLRYSAEDAVVEISTRGKILKKLIEEK